MKSQKTDRCHFIFNIQDADKNQMLISVKNGMLGNRTRNTFYVSTPSLANIFNERDHKLVEG